LGEKTAENLFLGFGCWRKRNFAKVSDKRFLFCINGIFIVKNANWVIILKYIIID